MEEWFTPFSLVLYLCHNISSDSNSVQQYIDSVTQRNVVFFIYAFFHHFFISFGLFLRFLLFFYEHL